MRRIPFLGFSMALLLVALAAPVSAATPFLDVSQEKGSSASAESGDCVENVPEAGDYTCAWSYVSAFDGWSRYNGERFRGERLCVGSSLSVFDSSEGIETYAFTGGCLEDADVTFGNSLASASASGTVPLTSEECFYDYGGDTFECTDPVDAGTAIVDLDWTGIPPVSKGSNRGRDQYEGCTSTYYSSGTSSEATVAGTIDGSAASFDWGYLNVGRSRFTYSCH